MPPNILLFYCSNLWALTTSAQKFLPGLLLRPKIPPRLLLAPQIAKGGYLYTPQIKFGRILNNSRFGRLYGVFLRRRHGAFLQIAPITAPSPVPAVFFLQMPRIGPPPTPSDFFANSLDWPATAPPVIKNSPTRLCRFLPGQQIAPVFCAMHFFSTN